MDIALLRRINQVLHQRPADAGAPEGLRDADVVDVERFVGEGQRRLAEGAELGVDIARGVAADRRDEHQIAVAPQQRFGGLAGEIGVQIGRAHV